MKPTNLKQFWARPTVQLVLGLLLMLPMLQSCSMCSTDHDGKDESVFNRITEEELAKFTPQPYTRGNGHSKAIDVRPRPEVRVTAPAGTFERTPEIRVTKPSDAVMARYDEQLRRVTGYEPLFAYDLDAGLEKDEVAPGRFLVEIDLKQLEVPEELYPYLTLYRTDGVNLLQECNVKVEDGKLLYEACQNTGIEVSIAFAIAVSLEFGVGAFNYVVKRPGKNMAIASKFEGLFPHNAWKKNDVMNIQTKDPFGTFNLRYRISETEKRDQTQQIVAKKERLEALSDSLFDQAEKNYDEAHPGEKPKLIPNWDVETRRREGIYAEYIRLMGKNKEVQDFAKDPDLVPPQSVLDIIKGGRLALRFCQAEDGLNLAPLSYVFDVFYTNSDYAGLSSIATATPVPMMGAFLVVNYDRFLTTKSGVRSYNTEMSDAMLVAMAHEISHIYEYTYLNFTPCRDQRFMEALGAYSEHLFAAWMKKNNYINYDPESAYGDRRLGYADQTLMEFYAWPLAENLPDPIFGISSPETDCGYVLGRILAYLSDKQHNPLHKQITFDDMMKGYAYQKTFLQDLLDIYGFKTANEFVPYYEAFCREHMARIVNKQKEYQGEPGDITKSVFERRFEDKESLKKRVKPNYAKYIPSTLFHAPYLCVMRFDQFGHNGTKRAQPFAVKVIQIRAEKEPEDEFVPYTLFAVVPPSIGNAPHFFTFLEGEDYHFTKDPLFIPQPWKGFENIKGSAKYQQFAAFFPRSGFETRYLDKDYWIDFVALYRPMLDPIVRGRAKDGTGILIDTREEPCNDLLEHGYVSGMQMAVRNNKTEQAKTFNVALEQCGKSVKIPYEKLDINKEDIDITVQTRWYFNHPNGKKYYSPASNKVNYNKIKKKEVQNIEEKSDTAEVKPTVKEEEKAEDDLGGADLNITFQITNFNIKLNPIDRVISYNDYKAEAIGRLVVKDGKFTLSIPAHTFPFSKDGHSTDANISEILLQGTCELTKTLQDGHERVEFVFTSASKDYRLTPFGWRYNETWDYHGDDTGPITYHHSYRFTPVANPDNPYSHNYLFMNDGEFTSSTLLIDFPVHMNYQVSPEDQWESKELDTKMEIYGRFK